MAISGDLMMLDLFVSKKAKRNVQRVPRSQVVANSLHQEEEERDTNQQAQNKQPHEKHTDQLSLS